MSLVTLHKIDQRADEYTAPYQHGYKAHDGCPFVVWSQKILVSLVQEEMEFSSDEYRHESRL